MCLSPQFPYYLSLVNLIIIQVIRNENKKNTPRKRNYNRIFNTNEEKMNPITSAKQTNKKNI